MSKLERPLARYDLTGQTFGRLYVVEFHHWYTSPRGKRYAVYWCRCECGKEVEAAARHLKSGSTISCGCFFTEQNRLPYGEAARHLKYLQYQYDAARRNLPWGLSEYDFHTLTKCNCHYCHLRGIETPPQQVSTRPHYYGEYLYNGIDRVDSEVGYFKWNCVPCCRDCNVAKGSKDVLEFEKQIEEQKKIKLE